MGYASCLHLQGSEERLEFFFASRENVKIDKPFLTPVSVQARPVGILPERQFRPSGSSGFVRIFRIQIGCSS